MAVGQHASRMMVSRLVLEKRIQWVLNMFVQGSNEPNDNILLSIVTHACAQQECKANTFTMNTKIQIHLEMQATKKKHKN